VVRRIRMLPGGPLGRLVPEANAEPRRRSELASRRASPALSTPLRKCVQRAERDRVPIRLVEQNAVLAFDRPLPPNRTCIRRRSGSANSRNSSSGSSKRNRPTDFVANGPCCHAKPIAVLLPSPRWPYAARVEELSHRRGNFHDMGLRCKVACIQELELCV